MSAAAASRRCAAIRVAGGDDQIRCLDGRAAAPDHRARGERADAVRHPIGVALDDAHRLEGNAESLGDHLGEDGLVPLALRLAADRHLDESRGQHPHLGVLARHAAGALEVRPDADAAQLAAPRGFVAPLRKPGGVGELERLVEAGDVVAGVVDGAGGRPIRERPDHVEASEGGAIATGLARGALDQPLDGVDALEATDAAIHVDRHGVGEGALEPQMNRGDGVEPGDHALHVQDDRDRHPRRDVGAEVLRRMHAEGGDVTARVEGQLTREHVIARLGVAEEALGPARRPT